MAKAKAKVVKNKIIKKNTSAVKTKKAATKPATKPAIKSTGKAVVKPAAKSAVKPASKPKPKVVKDVVASTNKTVKKYLLQLFKKRFSEVDGRYLLIEGSAIIQVVVRPWYDNDSVVDIFSYVVEGAKITPEISNFLLRKNATLHFGAFGLTFDNSIIFSYSLAGSHLDLNELKAALKMVAAISDFYDDEIVKIAGGKRGIDVQGMAIENKQD